MYFKNHPSVSILFCENIPEYEKLKLKKGRKEIEIPVLKYEYLIANKIKTFKERKEDRDIIDIIDLLKLKIKGRTINNEVWNDAIKYYGLKEEDVKEIIDIIKNCLTST